VNAETFQKFSNHVLKASDFKGLKGVTFAGSRELDLSVFDGVLRGQAWKASGPALNLELGKAGRWIEAVPLEQPKVEAAMQRIFPGTRVSKLEMIHESDFYYYERPEKRRWKVFPCYRAQIEGGAGPMTLYMEPYTGEVFLNHTSRSKLKRFLYQGLHGWDFSPFYRRPWWDLGIILLSLIGLGFSLTGVVLSCKWIMARLGRKGAAEPDRVDDAVPINS
jgi:hypothetical protein